MLNIIYISIIGINYKEYQLFRESVSEQRRKKADQFYFIGDSKRCVCAELLLQYSLYHKMGRLEVVDFEYNQFGKPYLKHVNDFMFNITHSGRWVAIAYGSSEVGIDIEKIQDEKQDIVNKFFSMEEKEYINTVIGEERDKRFTQIWTLKESYIKYIGRGLSGKLNLFSVNAIDGVVTEKNGKIQSDLMLKSYLFNTEYYMSVCCHDKEIAFYEIQVEDLIQFIRKNIR